LRAVRLRAALRLCYNAASRMSKMSEHMHKTMTKIRLLILFLFLASLGTPLAALAQAPLDTTITQNARLRSGPGTEWRIIAEVAAGSAVRLDGRAPGGGWVRGITQSGDVGWMVETALSASPDQIAALPSVWVDAPFNLAAPPAAGASSAPAESPETPAETPAEAPPAEPPPVTNPTRARGFNLGGHVAGFSDYAAEQMRRAGMTWVKRQIRAGQQDAAPAINEAHGRGFRILIGAVGDANRVGDDAYLDEFAGQLAAIAAQGADAIEVWNEPNIDREWAAGQISPERYTEMLRRAYLAIRNANPNTWVISGAPAPTGFFGGCTSAGCDDAIFVQRMAGAGAANYMDCIGVHYNEGILPPTARSGDPRGSSSFYSRYYGGMVDTYWNAFRGARPLCFTELGYLTPEGLGPLPGAFGWAENVTVAQQAAWLDQAASLAANSGRVRLMIIWNVDFTEYGADPMAGYAIIRPGGACPACDALGG
jgi:hypothetical protein